MCVVTDHLLQMSSLREMDLPFQGTLHFRRCADKASFPPEALARREKVR